MKKVKPDPKEELFDIDKEAKKYYSNPTTRYNEYVSSTKTGGKTLDDRKRIPNSDKLKTRHSLTF